MKSVPNAGEGQDCQTDERTQKERARRLADEEDKVDVADDECDDDVAGHAGDGHGQQPHHRQDRGQPQEILVVQLSGASATQRQGSKSVILPGPNR